MVTLKGSVNRIKSWKPLHHPRFHSESQGLNSKTESTEVKQNVSRDFFEDIQQLEINFFSITQLLSSAVIHGSKTSMLKITLKGEHTITRNTT